MPLLDRRVKIEHSERTTRRRIRRAPIAKPVGKFTCVKCGNLYRRKRSWRRHEKECGTLPGFQCLICLQRFMRKHHLTRHLQNLHKTDVAIMGNVVNFPPEDNPNLHSIFDC